LDFFERDGFTSGIESLGSNTETFGIRSISSIPLRQRNRSGTKEFARCDPASRLVQMAAVTGVLMTKKDSSVRQSFQVLLDY